MEKYPNQYCDICYSQITQSGAHLTQYQMSTHCQTNIFIQYINHAG